MHGFLEKVRKFKEIYLPSEILDENIGQVPSLIELINKAKEEWEDAKNLFNEVTDPDLIDHAIYRIESAEKKYMYLLKLANSEKVTNSKIELS
ncbi:MAG: YaaL family protein [Clostridia bacterium]|nr:YaaL family protein [Clostridia bacterium]